MLRLIPNILTFGRLVLAIIFLIMILYSPSRYAQGELPFPDFLDIAFILFVIAGLTDIIDGIVARKLNVTSKFGRMVDPLADKALVCGAFVCFAIIGEPKLFGFGPITLAAAEARGVNFAATVSGKVKMFLQSFAIGTVIIKMAHVQTATWGYWFTTVTFVIMLAVTVISGLRATQRSPWKKRQPIRETPITMPSSDE
ncbi:MAG: CDP-alcohol phosphatidyltransferase family protein [Planctomycetota bacterium]|jgi:CDP-diacylglycerol--glycerol-3-phosphate 3-phosphatidyltransferase